MTVFYFIAGLGLLVLGAELFVRGASRLAASFNISPLIIGLTVVSFGTSAPELFISLKASLGGQADIAVGNVVGSNIFNVLFILGISALITPLTVSSQLIRSDVPLMIFVSILAFIFARDGEFSRLDGAILASGLVGYLAFLYFSGGSDSSEEVAELTKEGVFKGTLGTLAQLVLGLSCLVLGSQWFVKAAVLVAELLGVSQLIIGLTIVSVGTSLPELMTSVVASLRGERDIAVGNVVGSNIFNILAVLGLTALVAPEGVAVGASLIAFDMPFMIVVAIACLPIFFTGGIISRWEGGVLLSYYTGYTILLILVALNHSAAGDLKVWLYALIVPLAICTAYTIYHDLKNRAL